MENVYSVKVVKAKPRWLFATDPAEAGMSGEWYAPDYDDADWGSVRTDLDAGWQAQGFTWHQSTSTTP